ncbi:cobalt transporter CbiM [Beggiatoa leptomitoformis]|uniref:Cobalt transporter CbiM n=1 Tax=Beggiatoa leptomitoformis TaxID=288004 RepID=A0A2N9YC06_9GAMM|nr:cobalt transporter CbiM [Beggiatoa leptomitoformis]ALG66731.1 cobalt transporter CbiM [Beggiatoa leptomitoformis]AUI67934.1 cobalt transporter CbiM [Beggiatoa leptomitoformis]
MHIAEGVLSLPVLVGSSLLAMGGIAIGLRHLEQARIPLAAVLSAVFFIASLIHIPVGVTSVHLVMLGLCGLLLGWAAFPAIFVALLLQTIFFGFGGLTTLGINTLIMSVPAVVCYYLFGQQLQQASAKSVLWRGSAAAVFAVALGVLIMASALYLSDTQAFNLLIIWVMVSHIPVMLVEGVITGVVMVFLYRVQPDLLDMSRYLTEAA